MQVSDAWRLNALEVENARLKKPSAAPMPWRRTEPSRVRGLAEGGKTSGLGLSKRCRTIVQATAVYALTFERFHRLAVALDLVPKTWGQRTPFGLERAKIEALAERPLDRKDLKTIAGELGLAEPASARLAREGWIDLIRQRWVQPARHEQMDSASRRCHRLAPQA